MQYQNGKQHLDKRIFNRIVSNPTDTKFYKDQLKKYQSQRIQKLIELRQERQQKKAKEQLDRIIRSRGIVIGGCRRCGDATEKCKDKKPLLFTNNGIEKHN